MGKKNESKATESKATDINAVQLVGTAKRAKTYDKFVRFTLDCASETPSGKTAHAFIPVIWFNSDSDETVSDDERVSVSGSIRTGSYTNKNGEKVYTVEVVAEKVIFE